MKQLLLIGGAAAVALGLSLGGAGTANAAPVPNSGTYNISFIGYCDGIMVTLPGNAGAPGAQAARTGCDSGALFGAYNNEGRIVLADATNTLILVINPNNTWVYYADCGTGQECVTNHGFWHIGAPAAPAHGTASTAKAGGLFGALAGGFAGHRTPGPNASTIAIGFDGYCDGETINLPGSGGAPGADGMRIGCASDPLIGAGGYNMVAMWDYAANDMWVNMNDHTWVGYTDCGDGTECEFNSGTWTRGAPAAPTKNRTVTSSNGR